MTNKGTEKHLKNSSPDGVHYLLEFFGCNRRQLNSVAFWEKLLIKAMSKTDAKILNKHFYKFSPYGLTGYFLLSASHVAFHTWYEYEYVACDVFTCGGKAETEGIVKHIADNLKHARVKVKKMKRGFRVFA
ncbi:MAG: adenosylmethionine decarboxylase [Dissulfurispiraceae bacterium]